MLKKIKNQKGMATLEIIPVIIVIALLINYSLGFFGVIHTGILNSMASRNYAFETFRNRTNLLYFHDVRGGLADGTNYKKFNTRVHGIASEVRGGSSTSDAIVTTRNIGFGETPTSSAGANDHDPSGGEDRGIFGIKDRVRNTEVDSAPVWIRPLYGICLNALCKAQ